MLTKDKQSGSSETYTLNSLESSGPLIFVHIPLRLPGFWKRRTVIFCSEQQHRREKQRSKECPALLSAFFPSSISIRVSLFEAVRHYMMGVVPLSFPASRLRFHLLSNNLKHATSDIRSTLLDRYLRTPWLKRTNINLSSHSTIFWLGGG
jgi:hypothetical protein